VKTDYAGHDAVYQRHRAEGATGWDENAVVYQEQELLLARILAAGRAPPSGRLLELGCGAGNISVWLARRGYEVCGVDIAPTAIEWAREKARAANVTAQFLVGDVCNLARFDEAPFDAVLDGHCLHCIIGADRPRFLATAARMLKPGGYLLVDTMCGPVIDPAGFAGYDPASRCTLRGDVATRYFGLPEEIRSEVQAAGFELLHMEMTPDQNHVNMIIEARKP